MKPFFTYYGGKWSVAPNYPRPVHDLVIEPFAGSAGYSVRYNAPRVLLYDLNIRVIGAWQFLIGSSPEDILRLPDVPAGASVRDLGICQEAQWLIGWHIKPAGDYPGIRPTTWAIKHKTRMWDSARRERIAQQIPQIKHWKAICGDYGECPDIEATWFVDPPYQSSAGRHYRHSRIDYSYLGHWTRKRPGQVIACDEAGADWLPFRSLYGAIGANTSRKYTEAVWTSEMDAL